MFAQAELIKGGLDYFLFPEDAHQPQAVALRFNDIHIRQEDLLPAIFQDKCRRFTHQTVLLSRPTGRWLRLAKKNHERTKRYGARAFMATVSPD